MLAWILCTKMGLVLHRNSAFFITIPQTPDLAIFILHHAVDVVKAVVLLIR